MSVNNATLQALARLIVAHRAYNAGEIAFAGEVLAGAWDHTNRSDIFEVFQILARTPSKVDAMLADVAKG